MLISRRPILCIYYSTWNFSWNLKVDRMEFYWYHGSTRYYLQVARGIEYAPAKRVALLLVDVRATKDSDLLGRHTLLILPVTGPNCPPDALVLCTTELNIFRSRNDHWQTEPPYRLELADNINRELVFRIAVAWKCRESRYDVIGRDYIEAYFNRGLGLGPKPAMYLLELVGVRRARHVTSLGTLHLLYCCGWTLSRWF